MRPVERPLRLVAADLDGTLLDPAGAVSPRTLAVARALRAAGIPLVPATSRRWMGAIPVAAALELEGPVVVYDGALVRHYPSGELISAMMLAADVARRAIEILVRHALRPIVQHATAQEEFLLIGPPVPRNSHARVYLNAVRQQVREVPVEELGRGDSDPVRVVAFGPWRRLRAAAAEIRAIPCGWQVLPLGSYGTSELSVFASGASKGHAVRIVAERLGVAAGEVFAIGDGVNDISMLRMAGFSVAMVNGHPRVHAAAQALTPDNSHDGAAQAIERYVLGRAPEALDDAGTPPADTLHDAAS
jgi:hydroxymethylpyrimidine pyrophosphatase-like HAD family hydrolase